MDKCYLNDALHWSLKVMRLTVHSKIKETPRNTKKHQETPRHYGRKPQTELTSCLNLPTGKNKCASANPETLQVYLFHNGNGG